MGYTKLLTIPIIIEHFWLHFTCFPTSNFQICQNVPKEWGVYRPRIFSAQIFFQFFRKFFFLKPITEGPSHIKTKKVDPKGRPFLFLYIPRKYAISFYLFFSLRGPRDERGPKAQNGSLSDRDNPIEQRTEAQYSGLYFWALINKTEESEVNRRFIDFYRIFPCVWVDKNFVFEQWKFLNNISTLLSRLLFATQHLTQIFIFCHKFKKGGQNRLIINNEIIVKQKLFHFKT